MTHLPGALLAEKFGGKHTLGLAILSTSILTLLVPFAVKIGDSVALIVLRIFMGFGQGIIYPALIDLTAHWAPPSEVSSMMAVIFVGCDLGIIVGSSLSGLILQYSSYGWKMVFYVFGSFGIIWYMFWLALVYNDPEKHPFISTDELNYLKESMVAHKMRKLPPIPWKHIMKSKPFWALMAAQIGHNWGFYTLLNDLPKYMSSVLKFRPEMNGYFTALPYIVGCFYILIISWVTDKFITAKYVSKTNARKINTSISNIGPAIFLVLASYAGCERSLVVFCFIIGVTLMKSGVPGIKVNPLDLSPNYAGTIMALTNGVGSLTGLGSSSIIGYIAEHDTRPEWQRVFWLSAIIFLACNTIFLIFASGEMQKWNNPDEMKKRKENRNSINEDN